MAKNISIKSPSMILFTQLLVFIYSIIIAICYFVSKPNPDLFVYPLSLALVIFSIWALVSWRMLARSLFDPYIIFLIAAILFNAGIAFLRIFFLDIDFSLFLLGPHSGHIEVTSLILVLISLCSFHFGGLIGCTSTDSSPSVEITSQRYVSYNNERRVIRQIGWLLILISVVPLFILLKEKFIIVMSGGYSMLFQSDAAKGIAAWPRILSTFMIPGILFLLAGSRGKSFHLGISVVLILIYSLAYFLIGSRSSAAMPLIAFCWIWHRLIRPLPRAFLLASATCMLVILFPIIAVYRQTALQFGNIITDLPALYTSFGAFLVSILNSMAQTIGTISWTINLVPKTNDFFYGLTYISAVLSIIPNLFWDIHPLLAYNPALWLVSEIAPKHAALGMGFGYSFIAEAYLNFGWVGSQLLLGLFGFFLAKFSLWANKGQQPLKYAVVGTFFSFFLFSARGAMLQIVRPLFWYSLLPYFACIVIMRMNGNKETKYSKMST